MKVLGIDLSLRSTGLVCIDGDEVSYKLVTPDIKKYNDTDLLIYDSNEICDFVMEMKPDVVALEGLSFGSLTGSKDILAGNFWYLKVRLSQIGYNPQIVPVLTWRSPLFTKDERKKHKEDTKLVKEWKVKVKDIKGNARKDILAGTEQLFFDADIKHLTFQKLPVNVRIMFENAVGLNSGVYDLSDAYFIANHIKQENQ
jgi:hypothetical protein